MLERAEGRNWRPAWHRVALHGFVGTAPYGRWLRLVYILPIEPLSSGVLVVVAVIFAAGVTRHVPGETSVISFSLSDRDDRQELTQRGGNDPMKMKAPRAFQGLASLPS